MVLLSSRGAVKFFFPIRLGDASPVRRAVTAALLTGAPIRTRLPTTITPEHYDLAFVVDLGATVEGTEMIGSTSRNRPRGSS